MSLDLGYLNSRRLLLPSSDSVDLVLVGCGGTGSWLAPSVARVARLLAEKFQKRTLVYFIDPDVVEKKNCYRQNFCEAEIGRNKAETLAFRYGLAWGVHIVAIPERLGSGQVPGGGWNSSLSVYIGCVDNPAARISIQADSGSKTGGQMRSWWLDCGNHQSAGQVVLGCAGKQPDKDPYELPEFCTWLPSPAERHPDLLESMPEEVPADTANLSCADLAMLDSQGLAINQRIAAEATDYLVRMLLTRDLRKWGTYIDLASGTTKSRYITE